MYQIVEKYQEPSGRWCVRAVVDPTEAVFLWFAEQPTQEEVDAEVEKYKAQKGAEQITVAPDVP